MGAWIYLPAQRDDLAALQSEASSGHLLWTVGFFAPDGTWYSDSDHDVREDAAARVHYLNGGSGMSNPEWLRELRIWCEHAAAELRESIKRDLRLARKTLGSLTCDQVLQIIEGTHSPMSAEERGGREESNDKA